MAAKETDRMRRPYGPWALAAILLTGTSACKNDLEKVAAVDMPVNAPDRLTTGAEYILTDSGRVRNRLTAGRIAAWATEPRRTEFSEGLELQFLNADGRPRSTLTARRGLMLPSENRMEVNEQVVFINAQGERLETEQLIWHQDSARIHTDRPVRIQRGADVVHGVGLDAAEDMSTYNIRRVTGELYLGTNDHQAD